MKSKTVKNLSDDDLLSEFMDLFRMGRSREDGLPIPERRRFKALVKEVAARRLLKNL